MIVDTGSAKLILAFWVAGNIVKVPAGSLILICYMFHILAGVSFRDRREFLAGQEAVGTEREKDNKVVRLWVSGSLPAIVFSCLATWFLCISMGIDIQLSDFLECSSGCGRER